MKRLSLAVALVIALSGIVYLPIALGAVDVFLKIEGVEGESTEREHKGWIDIISTSWGTPRGGGTSRSDAPLGSGAGSLKVVKRMDSASRQLMQLCSSGKHVKEAVLHVSNTEKKETTEYLISDIFLFDCSPSDAGGIPAETISINYRRIDYRPSRQTPKPK